jgi:hypothetical protein
MLNILLNSIKAYSTFLNIIPNNIKNNIFIDKNQLNKKNNSAKFNSSLNYIYSNVNSLLSFQKFHHIGLHTVSAAR